MRIDRRCPDDGTCHHRCKIGCFRVASCEPLSSAGYDNDEWPESVRILGHLYSTTLEEVHVLSPISDLLVRLDQLTGTLERLLHEKAPEDH